MSLRSALCRALDALCSMLSGMCGSVCRLLLGICRSGRAGLVAHHPSQPSTFQNRRDLLGCILIAVCIMANALDS